MEIACTICSRKKAETEGPMPADELYLGAHVALVGSIAREGKLPFFILSGKHGLIPASKKIRSYDHLLVEEEIVPLAKLVRGQLLSRRITCVHFYFKARKSGDGKDNWWPYRVVMIRAALDARARIVLGFLPNED